MLVPCSNHLRPLLRHTRPPTLVQPTILQPTQPTPLAPVVINVPSAAPPPDGRRGSGVLLGMSLGFVVIAAVVIVVVKVLDKNTKTAGAPSHATVVVTSTTAAPATATSAPVVTAVAPTAAPAPTSTSTILETTVSPSTAAPAPTTPPVSGPGTPQVLRDPMSSGASYAEVSGAFGIAQELADALAEDDWNRVRQLEPAKAGFTDAQFSGYIGLDRASLILVDARPDGDGYRQLVVSVANEQNGAQTTLYCLEWSASTVTGFVTEHSPVVGKLIRVDGTVSSDGVLNDPSLLNLVMTRCVWH